MASEPAQARRMKRMNRVIRSVYHSPCGRPSPTSTRVDRRKCRYWLTALRLRDHAAPHQVVDPALREPQLPQNLSGVLTNERRRTFDTRRGLAHLDGGRDHPHGPRDRVIVAREAFHVLDLRVLGNFAVSL